MTKLAELSKAHQKASNELEEAGVERMNATAEEMITSTAYRCAKKARGRAREKHLEAASREVSARNALREEENK